jgi:Protein tyrosine and serine/threonine kinase
MSPECARGDPYNAKSDVYTVALLLHELISLDKPYDDIPSDLHDDMVFYSAARPPLPPKWPEPFKSTLQRAWNERIPIRPTMVEFQTIWKSQLKSVLLEDKRRRYSRGLGGRQAVLPNVDSSVTVPNKSTRAFEIWNSTRTSPDSCQELSESCSE